jgi:hypothetical protein
MAMAPLGSDSDSDHVSAAHSGPNLAAATGASLKELMARLGHSSTRTALIYQDATRDRDQAIAKALGGLVQQVRLTGPDQASGDA